MRLLGGAELQDGCSEITRERGIWWQGEDQVPRLAENSVGEANEVSFKGFQWKENMGYVRGQREDDKFLERARQQIPQAL